LVISEERPDRGSGENSFTPGEPTALPKENDGIEKPFLATNLDPEVVTPTRDLHATGPLTPDVDRPGSAPDALTGLFAEKKRQVRSKAEIRIALGLDPKPGNPGLLRADQTIRDRNRSEPKND
jgi:hypothetical protein